MKRASFLAVVFVTCLGICVTRLDAQALSGSTVGTVTGSKPTSPAISRSDIRREVGEVNQIHGKSRPIPNSGRLVPLTRWNQFAGSVGGPVIQNKLFYFGGFQGARRNTAAPPCCVPRRGKFGTVGRT